MCDLPCAAQLANSGAWVQTWAAVPLTSHWTSSGGIRERREGVRSQVSSGATECSLTQSRHR